MAHPCETVGLKHDQTLRASRMTHTLFKQADTCRCNNVATHALPASFLRFFVFSFAPPPPGQGWGSLGPHGQIQPYAPSKFHRTPQVALPYALADTYPTHARHMPDTCSTHVWQAGAVLEMHGGVENGYDLRFIARIRAQHG